MSVKDGWGRNVATVRKIFRRNVSQGFLGSYSASQLGLPSEAPNKSQCFQCFDAKFGRTLNFLSLGERFFYVALRYIPEVIDIRDQHMLFPFGGPHPLSYYPEMRGVSLPEIIGTRDLADRMHLRHPETIDKNEAGLHEVFPLLGDLLAVARTKERLRAVEVFVKNTVEELESPDRRSSELMTLHHTYFHAAGIPVARVAYSCFPDRLVDNLIELRGYARLPVALSESPKLEDVIAFLGGSVYTRPACLAAAAAEGTFNLPKGTAIDILRHAIWHRYITCDLYARLDMSRPLRRETRNALSEIRAALLPEVA